MRLIGLATLLLITQACATVRPPSSWTWREMSLTEDHLADTTRLHFVRVVGAGGDLLYLADARVQGDSLVGERLTEAPPPYARVALPLRSVRRLERGYRPGNVDYASDAVRREVIYAFIGGMATVGLAEILRHE